MSSLRMIKDRQPNRHRSFRANFLGLLMILGLLIAPATPATGASDQADAPAASPYTWTPEVADGPPFFYMMTDRSLRFEKAGSRRPCVAYGGDHLYYSCWNSATDTWTTETVDSAPMVGSYAALAFNVQNRPFISYYDANQAVLKLAFKLPSNIWDIRVVDIGTDVPPVTSPVIPEGFVEPETLTAEQEQEAANSYWDQLWTIFPHLNIFAPGFIFGKVGVGKHTSIDIGTDNIVHVSYYDEIHGALKHAYWNLNTYPAPPITEFVDYRHEGDVGLWSSLAVDQLNRPQISYMDEKYDDLRYAIKKGDDWDIMLVDNGVNVGPFSSIAIDPKASFPAMYPRIIYMSFNYDTSHYALRYANLQTDNTTWTKGVIDGSSGVGLFASLAISPDGKYHASYYDGLKGDLLYMASSNGATWSGRTTVATKGNQGMFTSIAYNPIQVNNKYQPFITYVDASNGLYKMANKSGNIWLTALTIGSTGNVGLNTSLALGSSGVPHISYLNETRGQLKHAWTVAGSWNTEVITHTAYLGTSNAIGLAFESIPKVAYYAEDQGELRLSTRLGAWQETVVDSYRDVGAFVSMALDASFTPHISYVDQTQDRLMYATWDLGVSKWYTQTLAYEGIGGYTSIALGDAGLFGQQMWAISYYDFTHENLMLTYMGQGGTPQTVQIYSLGNPNDDIPVLEPYSSVDYDSTGRIHIAFYEESMGYLQYAIVAPPNPPVIDRIDLPPGHDVGRFIDMVIDRTNDHRHLCYYDTTDRDLIYAYWDGTWDFQLVDSIGDVGMFCSIDIRASDGSPGISYYDASNADLKFARTYPLPLAIPSTIYLPIAIR